jgi:hypothetical protein
MRGLITGIPKEPSLHLPIWPGKMSYSSAYKLSISVECQGANLNCQKPENVKNPRFLPARSCCLAKVDPTTSTLSVLLGVSDQQICSKLPLTQPEKF